MKKNLKQGKQISLNQLNKLQKNRDNYKYHIVEMKFT